MDRTRLYPLRWDVRNLSERASEIAGWNRGPIISVADESAISCAAYGDAWGWKQGRDVREWNLSR